MFTFVKQEMITFVNQNYYMEINDLKTLYKAHKEPTLFKRYITHKSIYPLWSKYTDNAIVNIEGTSVLGNDIYSITLGAGKKKILMWSQMHGNESTTTKAIFDLLNTLVVTHKTSINILEECTLCIIPMLNPDGAAKYNRLNANNEDLNRDAQKLLQPESRILRDVFNTFKPNFCFNLHGQRTIFSAGFANKSATMSFLSPAEDKECLITDTRKIAMEIIANVNTVLQNFIPNQIGVYDDAFNINCVGDTFQTKGVPTILFEAGHYKDDYNREQTREFVYYAYLTSLLYISKNRINGSKYQSYFNIPENQKLFFDVIIRNVKQSAKDAATVDIAFQFKEILNNETIEFLPIVAKIGNLQNFYGHKNIDGSGRLITNPFDKKIELGSENVFVKLNNEKTVLNLK